MKPTLTILALAITALALATNQPAPKAAASPAPSDRTAEVEAFQAQVADLTEQLRVASATTPSHAESEPREESPAPLVVTTPGPRTQPAAYVAAYSPLPRHQLRSPQCAGGACGVQAAAEPRRFSFQAQPVRRFLFRRR